MEAVSRTQSLWDSVRESLRGSRRDHTSGELGHSILVLAIPMILEMAMESLFAIVDAYFVSGLGTDAVAAVALTESLMALLYGLAIGLSMAATAMVARRVGEGDEKGASIAAAQAILLGLFIAVPIAILGFVFAPNLLSIMGGQPSVIATGINFTRLIFCGSVSIFLLFLNNAILRGCGDAAYAMRSLWIANIINIALNPCLILGLGPFPQLGLVGSAAGTTIGRTAGVLFQFWILFGGMSRVHLHWGEVRVRWDILTRLLRVSVTGIVQFLISTASWMGLIRITATFGSAALAGYMLAIRMVIFAILPAWGLCNAAATLVGQNLGAGKPERSEQAVYRAGLYNMFFLGGIGLLFFVFADPLMHIFSTDPEVIRLGATCLRTISLGNIFYAWGMVGVQAFNGAGDTMTPTIINFICLWLLQIPIAWALSHGGGMGPTGVYTAIPVAQSILAAVAIIMFRRGSWKQKRI